MTRPAPGAPRARLHALYARQRGLCHYCDRRMNPLADGDPFHDLAATKDHRVSRSQGGRRGGDNVVLACRRCNGLKGDMPEQLFVAIRAALEKDTARKWHLVEAYFKARFLLGKDDHV